MAKTSLGKVGILPKGEYSSATQYLRLDIVSYNGSSYLCIKDCIGIDVTNKEYWLLIAQKGDKGDIGEKGEKGDAGKDFSIYKTYTSISAMESDASNVPEGEFVLIASNVEDEDNAKLYVKGEDSFVYLTDLSGATGIKGEKGEKGDKPVNGVDYNTPEEKEEFKNEVVSTATTEVEQNIETIKEQAIQEFNSNASTKTNEYNDNTTTKLSEYNTNANSKVEEYNSNATQKTNTFNENATTQTETFNNNATSKTNDFNSNASTKTDEFNTNYEEKLESINEASTSIEAERKISDNKYARALKTPVTDVESTQIYAENDVVNDLVVDGVELTQETREGYNKVNLSNFRIGAYNYGTSNINPIFASNNTRITLSPSLAIEVKPNTQYTVFFPQNYKYSVGQLTSEKLTNGDSEWMGGAESEKKIITTKKNTNYIAFNIKSATNDNEVLNLDDFKNIEAMMYEGTEEKPYEEYGASPSIDFPSEVQVASEQNITINETNITIPLINSAIGQYADTIDRENNVQNKVIQELILNGDENFNMQIEPDYLRTPDESIDYYINFFSVLTNSELLCNTFKNKTFDSKYRMYENVEGISSGGGYKRLYIRIKKERLETVDVNGIKKFFKKLYDAGTPVKVYYVVGTPTTNPLSEEVQTALSNFKLYKDLNNIAIDGGSMSFIYNKSLLRALEEQSELSASLLERIQALEAAQVNSVGGN